MSKLYIDLSLSAILKAWLLNIGKETKLGFMLSRQLVKIKREAENGKYSCY